MLLFRCDVKHRDIGQGYRMTKTEFREWVKSVDIDGDGQISSKELRDALRALGLHFTWWKTFRCLRKVDLNRNDQVDGEREIELLMAYAQKHWGIIIY